MLFELFRATSDTVSWNRLHCTGMEGQEGVVWGAYGNESTGWIGGIGSINWKGSGLIGMVTRACVFINTFNHLQSETTT